MTERNHSNTILARWAMDSLKEYDRVSGGGVSLNSLIPLLIASLLHLAKQRGLSAERVISEATELFDTETRE